MPTTDPFTQTYNALAALLFGNAAIAARVRPGNRVNLATAGQWRTKPQHQPGDLPELRLLPLDADVQPGTSHHRMLDLRFAVVLLTDHSRIDAGYAELLWLIYAAIEGRSATDLGLAFVTDVRLGDLKLGDDLKQCPANIAGWGAVCTVRVSLAFPLEQLRTPEPWNPRSMLYGAYSK